MITFLRNTSVILALLPGQGMAHSKWFSSWQQDTSITDPGLLLHQQWLLVMCLAVLGVYFGLCLWHALPENLGMRILSRLEDMPRDCLYRILAIAAVMSVALCWKNNVILAPELGHTSNLVSLSQFAILTLGLMQGFRLLLPALLLLLYVSGVVAYGPVHMIDYMHYLGMALCLHFWRPGASEPQNAWGWLSLRALTGFSLCWLGLEKVVHPQWSLEVVAGKPWLAMGLPVDFFVKAAAMTEFTIGFFILAGLWVRVSALVLSILMLFTASFFGMREILGHLPIHAVLIVLMMAPPSSACSTNQRKLWPQVLYKAGCHTTLYVMVLVGTGTAYYLLAWSVCVGEGVCENFA